jgi:hypothetical protein
MTQFISHGATEMGAVKPRTNWGNVGAGAAAGFFLPSFLGMGSGGAASTPMGGIVSMLPLILLAGGGLYAFQMLKK